MLEKRKDIVLNLYHSMDRFRRQQIDYIFLCFPENRIRYFIQIISIGDNLHEMSKPVFLMEWQTV